MFTCLACKRTTSKNPANRKIESTLADSLEPSISEHTQHDTLKPKLNQAGHGVTGRELVDFAKILLGVPYRYASIDPSKGFDCSGFITYVFNHFNIEVPRSSIDFTNAGKEVDLQTDPS